MYILLCSNGHYYTGSTKDLQLRIVQHNEGIACNYTAKYGPVKLVYYEKFDRIDDAFNREKQVQKWTIAKKKALIEGKNDNLKGLSRGLNASEVSKQSAKIIFKKRK